MFTIIVPTPSIPVPLFLLPPLHNKHNMYNQK